ncbi:Uma2 family endonuclease [Nostoc sp.]|uniref:Uma2 family endonuclease n=1 Tax=Nostoc sp. TaxID=1180 RepID=UPI002FF9267D
MTPAAMSDDKPFGFRGAQSTETVKTATPSTQSVYATPTKESPLLFEELTWREFKAVEQLLDRPGYRLSFLDGVLEILRMPGEPHETVKKRVAALLELYLLMAGFDFTPTGSMTLESESGAVKREADESYKLAPGRMRPDLAIEVVFTSGGINKLEAYKRLLIPEVWFWEDGVLEVYSPAERRQRTSL